MTLNGLERPELADSIRRSYNFTNSGESRHGNRVAQRCYNGDLSFLREKLELMTSCKIKTIEQIVQKFVTVD